MVRNTRNSRKRSYTGKGTAPYTKRRKTYTKPKMTGRALVKFVKRVTMKAAEPKCVRKSVPKFEMFHNQTSVLTLNANSFMPTQGVSDNQRVGDQINLIGYRMRLLIGQKADRPNVTFRWWIVSTPKGSAYAYNNWLIPTTGNVLLDDMNKDYVKQYKTGFWRPNQASLAAAGGKEYTFAKKIWLPYKKLLKFGPGDGLVSHNDNDLHFVIAPYDAYGTLESDNIAYCQLATDIFYRDP